MTIVEKSTNSINTLHKELLMKTLRILKRATLTCHCFDTSVNPLKMFHAIPYNRKQAPLNTSNSPEMRLFPLFIELASALFNSEKCDKSTLILLICLRIMKTSPTIQ